MSKLGVWVLSIATVLFIVVLAGFGVGYLRGGTTLGVIVGIALILMAVLGLWALWAEITFGRRTQQLAQELDAAGELPADEVSHTPSGRVVKEEAEALIAKYRAIAEADPSNWKALYNLGLVYDAAGDRKSARAAMRQALRLHG